MAVVILDALLVKTGMAKNDLFVGAEFRKTTNLSRLDFLIEGILRPIASQIFITGKAYRNVITRHCLWHRLFPC